MNKLSQWYKDNTDKMVFDIILVAYAFSVVIALALFGRVDFQNAKALLLDYKETYIGVAGLILPFLAFYYPIKMILSKETIIDDFNNPDYHLLKKLVSSIVKVFLIAGVSLILSDLIQVAKANNDVAGTVVNTHVYAIIILIAQYVVAAFIFTLIFRFVMAIVIYTVDKIKTAIKNRK